MSPPRRSSTPRLAERLLRRAWPGSDSIVLIGDLDEEYSLHILPRRGLLKARLWYWRQVLLSLPVAAVRRLDQRRQKSPRKDRLRPKQGGLNMDPLLQDLHYALRGLAHRPGLSLVVILTLALGIGAGTAIFSVVNAVVLDELPYQRPDDLIRLMPDQAFPIGKAAALYLQEHSKSFEMAAWGRSLFPLSGQGEPEDARGAVVFDNHFSVLGAPPALGRGFLPADAQPGAAKVAILSHELWVRRFGSDPSIVGRSILIGDAPHQVAGVMGADHQPIEEDWLLWVPADREPQSHLAMAANGRLRAGFTIAQAEQELKRLLPQFWKESRGYQATAEDLSALRVVPLRNWILGDHEAWLMALLGAVVFVLLIVCANVANLLLALGNSRRQEMGVRLALGAARGRLIRQLLTESALLGIVGGAAGLLAAAWAVGAGVALLPPQIPRSHNIQIDAAVLGFGLTVSLVSALLFGIAPALRCTSRSITWQINSAARTLTSSAKRLRFNQGLVAAEVALSVVLVAGAGLMLRSLWALQQVDPGFNPQGVVIMRPAPPRSRYPNQESVYEYYRQASRAINRIPQVREVGQIQFLPMTSGGWWASYRRAGHTLPAGQDPPSTSLRVVSPRYFAALQVSLLKGRTFTDRDNLQAQQVAVVNRTLARQGWPGEDPVGQSLLLGRDDPFQVTVVGVVEDVRQSSLRTESHPEAYLPFAQQFWPRMYYAVRVDGPAEEMVSAVQDAIWSVDRQVSLSGVGLLEDAVNRTFADSRFLAVLLSVFGMVALLLGAVGVYGVMFYLVSQRTRELGIRIALGAASRHLLGSTVIRGMIPVLLGLAAGLPGALACASLLGEALFQVTATDPATYLAVPLLLSAVAVLALYLPARRASRVDPVMVLRGE